MALDPDRFHLHAVLISRSPPVIWAQAGIVPTGDRRTRFVKVLCGLAFNPRALCHGADDVDRGCASDPPVVPRDTGTKLQVDRG